MKRVVCWVPLVAILAGFIIDERTAADAPAGTKDVIRLADCRVQLIDQVVLASDRPGILDFVEPEEGDYVEAGVQVAGLKDEVARAALAVAKHKMENDVQKRYAEKASQVAQAEYEKALETNRRVPGTVPDIEVRRLKLAAERTLLQIEQATHEMVEARLTYEQTLADLKTYRVEAPFAGVVTRIYKRKGEAVRQGDPILELVSTRRMRVEGYLDVQHAWTVKPGHTVRVKLDVPGVDLPVESEVFEGRVVFVDKSVQPVTRKVRVWAEVTNRDDLLRAGLTATMEIFPNDRVAAAR
ncbi:MAG: HlyD family efflux transporter periplasmic adaptor subunit [Planctomycetota bacterium]|nr:MAG: HlyD family efflux transporter periplasmic adaptor subunit [Planctomycetota bacterium]